MLVTATIYVFYLAITTLEKINIKIIRLDNDIDIDSASSLNLLPVIVYLDLNSQMKDVSEANEWVVAFSKILPEMSNP